MRYRKLRIAFSATCLVACVLVVVLWVRSYWRHDFYKIAIASTTPISVGSVDGALRASWGGHSDILKTPGKHIIFSNPELCHGAFGFGILRFANDVLIFCPYWFA